MFLLRSLMFVPGHNQRLIDSAARSDADAIIMDLEDSVQPSDNKERARKIIKSAISAGKFRHKHVFVRVNDRESGHLLRDISACLIDGIDGFVYPKSHSGNDIYFFDKLLETIEYEYRAEIGRFKIIPLIETAEATLRALEIARSSPRVIGLAFGCEDFVSDLEGIHDKDSLSIASPRALIAMAAKAARVAAIDTVHIHVHDLENLERNLKIARVLGYDGMLVLHPKELQLVHRYFSPSDEEVAEALEMLQLVEEAEREGKGVAIKNGKFVGPPMLIAAKKVLAKHKIIKGSTKNA